MASMSATVKARPQNGRGSVAGRLGGPDQLEDRPRPAGRTAAAAPAPASRVRRASMPTAPSAAVVRSRSGVRTTTWSMAVTPLGCGRRRRWRCGLAAPGSSAARRRRVSRSGRPSTSPAGAARGQRPAEDAAAALVVGPGQAQAHRADPARPSSPTVNPTRRPGDGSSPTTTSTSGACAPSPSPRTLLATRRPSVPRAPAAVAGYRLDVGVLAPLPELVVDASAGVSPVRRGQQLDGVQAAGTDLDLLGAAGPQQVARRRCGRRGPRRRRGRRPSAARGARGCRRTR